MKRSARRCTLLLTLLSLNPVVGAVVQTPGRIDVDGVLNGGVIAPDVTGDTLDYLKFEVLTTSEFTFRSETSNSYRFMLASFIGLEDEFGFVGSPFFIDGRGSFSRNLTAGTYVIAFGMKDDTSYDIFDGYVPVNPEGGGFISGPYSYSITGNALALEFRDGELDGTFKITQLPEPSAATLLGLAAAIPLTRRKRRRPAA